MFTIEILQLLISVIFTVIKKMYLERLTASYSKENDLIYISEYSFKKIRGNVKIQEMPGDFVKK